MKKALKFYVNSPLILRIAIGLAIGVITGNWAYKRIPNKLFTYIVYAYIGISGTIIFFSA